MLSGKLSAWWFTRHGTRSLGQGDLLEEGMATHSSILAMDRGGYSLGSQRVGHNLATGHAHRRVKGSRGGGETQLWGRTEASS